MDEVIVNTEINKKSKEKNRYYDNKTFTINIPIIIGIAISIATYVIIYKAIIL
jgi:hypothetical protein